jgi:histone acetyltransferase (RNA polymerase elongator complex component)
MIIPFFIPYKGCPNRCIFCNAYKIAGNYHDRITEHNFRETVLECIGNSTRKREHVQIAFYGSNFTGMNRNYQAELLGYANQFIAAGQVHDVRISTRPDNIDNECLDLLEQFSVTTVEIGAQSLVDEVLSLSNRGHSSTDVKNAMETLKNRGFKTGIHLMVGLPGDNRIRFEYTIHETIALKPDMVRIHPTLVFQDTDLAENFFKRKYTPLTLSEAIDLCKYSLRQFEEANIPVIRLGLQTNWEMEQMGAIIAGPYHPAFRSLVEESLFFDMASALLAKWHVSDKHVLFSVPPHDASSFRGQRNRNMHRLKELYSLKSINVCVDPDQARRTIAITVDGKKTEHSKGCVQLLETS